LTGEEAGLATMLTDLIRQNLARDPRKRTDYNKLDTVLTIVVSDADVSVTLAFTRGSLDIRTGAGMSDIRITATAETVLGLCSLRIRRGIPMLFDSHGRAMLRKMLGGELRIDGILRHPVQLVRFARLMSVNG
jgi:hypothetical protein